MHLDLRQLRHFIALVEYRNFGLAAQSVNISQSAFSRSIQALEQSFGTRLIDLARKPWITSSGESVLYLDVMICVFSGTSTFRVNSFAL